MRYHQKRAQLEHLCNLQCSGRTAVSPPGAAREDWKIVRVISELVDQKLPYDTLKDIRERIGEIAPQLIRFDSLEASTLMVRSFDFFTPLYFPE